MQRAEVAKSLERKDAPAGKEARELTACPNCQAIVQSGDIVCVACGTNLLTGQKVALERRLAAPLSGGGRAPYYIAAAVIAAVLLIGIGYGAYFMFRDPVHQATRLAEAGRMSEASQMLEDYVHNNPDSARAFHALGRIQWQTRQYGAAADTYERLMELEPTNTGASRKAVAALRAVNNDANRNREMVIMETHVERFPEDADMWRLLAMARGLEGDMAGKLDALERLIALRGAGEPDARAFLGVALALDGDSARGRQQVNHALEQAPNDPDLLAAMGFISHMHGAYDDATINLRAAVQNGSSLDREARSQLGLLLVSEGRYAEALDHLEAVRNQPNAPASVRFFYAVALHALGRNTDARTAFDQVANEGGEFAALAHAYLGEIYYGQNDLQRARESAERAAEADPMDPMVLTLMGRIHLRENEEAQARELFRRAVQADPEYPPARLENGLSHIRRNAFAEGIRELEQYVELAEPGADVNRVETLVQQLRRAAAGEEGIETARARRTAAAGRG